MSKLSETGKFTHSGIPEHTSEAIDRIETALQDCYPYQPMNAQENQDLIEHVMTDCKELLRFTQAMVNFHEDERGTNETKVEVIIRTVSSIDPEAKEEAFMAAAIEKGLISLDKYQKKGKMADLSSAANFLAGYLSGEGLGAKAVAE